jgi:UDP-2,3-diacylglucosamine hydrolase
MPNIYFISDVHLGYGRKEEDRIREQYLLKFLDSIKDSADILFILGDLFDFWFEYRHVVPKGYFRTLAKLKELTENNIEIHYLIGNHDCLIQNYFEKEIGMKIYHKYIIKEINNKKFYLHHGDGLSKRDLGYKIIKAILRNKFDQWLFSLIHPDIGIWLGKLSSKKSRTYTSKKNYGPTNGLYEFARSKINEGYDYIIMGHIHKMIYEKINDGYYINLGDWIENYSYAFYDGENIHLKKFEITNL